MPRRHLDREEVCGSQHLPMHREELRPTHPCLAALRGGIQVMATQDIAHRDVVDRMAQICQGTLDAAVAPGCILFRHADHELLNLLGDTRSTQRSSLLAPVTL